MSKKLWLYWQSKPNRPDPPLLRLCIQSVRRHNDDVELLDEQKVLDLGGHEPIALTRGKAMTRRADLVRLWLLREFGGAWLDTDYICLRPVTLFKPLGSGGVEFVARQTGNGASNNAIASLPGGRFVSRLYDRAVRMLKSGRPLPYMAIGPSLVSQEIRKLPPEMSEMVRVLPQTQYAPVPWRQAKGIFGYRAADWQFEQNHFWNPTAVGYHLTGGVLRRFSNRSEDQLMRSPLLIGFLLRKAFGRVVPGRAKALLDRLPLRGKLQGVEVGVENAGMSRVLLQQRPELVLHLVDPWEQNQSPEYAATGDFHSTARYARNWPKIYSRARRQVEPFGTRAVFHRGYSVPISAWFDDYSLDFVFIDADHSQKAVAEDINAWFPKVKSGGWLCGHDYEAPNPKLLGVKRAVDEFILRSMLTLEKDANATWFVQVP